jgi:hypothetical protein
MIVGGLQLSYTLDCYYCCCYKAVVAYVVLAGSDTPTCVLQVHFVNTCACYIMTSGGRYHSTLCALLFLSTASALDYTFDLLPSCA